MKQAREGPLTSDEAVYLCQSDVMMVDVAVFQQTPELQAGQQEGVVWRLRVTKAAVETVDRPQLRDVSKDHELHLLVCMHAHMFVFLCL